MQVSSLAGLLARCRAGDQEAWRALLERFGALILSVPRRYGLDASRSDDVFAEVCLALVKALPSLRDPQALPQWLLRTAARATWEVARKWKPEEPAALLPLAGGALPAEQAALLEEEQAVRDALREVPERCRELLRLLYFAVPEPSYDEIARKLKVPRGSLGPTRRRCLEKLRGLLAERLGGDVSGGSRAPS